MDLKYSMKQKSLATAGIINIESKSFIYKLMHKRVTLKEY